MYLLAVVRKSISNCFRSVWRRLPLSVREKQRIKNELFRRFSFLFGWTATYTLWKGAVPLDERAYSLIPSGAPSQRRATRRGEDLTRKITLVSMIKNERNVIEMFAAHALAMFDQIIFVDHLSNDGTSQYLVSLSQLHPEIKYFKFDEPGYYQSEVMTWVVRNVVDKSEDGWVFFMDADEYLPFSSRIEFNGELAKYEAFPVISMPWLNLVPIDMESGEVKGARFLMPPRTAVHHKIAFQPNLIPFDDYVVAQGNHALLIGQSQQCFPAERAFPIYHLPIRTKQQLCDKIRSGVESYRRMGTDRGNNLGFHWDEISRLIDDRGLSDDLMADMIARYGEPLLPPFGKSLKAMIEEGYSEIQLNICTAGEILRFDDVKPAQEALNKPPLVGSTRPSDQRNNSKRESPIVHDVDRCTLRFRT